jgi:glycosyltransferase involved in cell wall biosynthesis
MLAAAVAGARRPLGTLRAVLRALRLAPSLRELPRWLAYAVQASVAASMLRDEREHVHTHFSAHLGLLLDAVRGPGMWSASVHGPAEFDGPKAWLLPLILRHATWVRTISAVGRAICLTRAPDGLATPVVVNRLGLMNVTNHANTSLRPRNGKPFRFVTVGRLSVEKGQRVLLAALKRARESGAELSLRCVGGGPLEEALRREAMALGLSPHVEFTGWLSPSQVSAHLADADAFVSSSFAEGIPLVLMEAMAAGLPCIATSVGGVAELVVHGESGLLVAPADDLRLAESMITLAGDAVLRARLVAGGHARLAADFDLRRNVAELAHAFARRLAPDWLSDPGDARQGDSVRRRDAASSSSGRVVLALHGGEE